MLGVGLRKLCPLDSFGYAFREKKTVRNSTPEDCKMEVQNGLQVASGPLFGASWAQLRRQGRLVAVFGRSWGRSWGTWHALRAVLGASWCVPGRSWAPLGGPLETSPVLI